MNTFENYEKRMNPDEEFPVDLFLNQIYQRGEYFSPHWHEHIELHYILKGRTTICCNHQVIQASQGEVIIVNSNELHVGTSDTGRMEAIVIIFALDSFTKDLVQQNVLFQPLIQEDKWLNRLFTSIYQENQNKQSGYKLACKGMIYELIAYLVRNYGVENLSEREGAKRKRELERLNTVLQYIGNNYSEPVTIPQLAKMMHVSEGRFGHLFKENVGKSPLNYINEVRLKKTVHLLQQGRFNVSEAALEAGFCDINHFGRQFKKYYGCTPTEFIKKQQNCMIEQQK